MRILSLRFANLASLAGEWTIHFDDPAFTTHGIFAITGPTGAGKSTLLDAICLALYGRTPRLKGITSGENAILSRHCQTCFAEVRFQTSQGLFLSRWTQDSTPRVRKLKPPTHVLVQEHGDDPPTELCSVYKETPRAVESVTGLDYDRFTRSMLLAQGDFAAFLKLDTAKRADVLNRITGTEIYAEISRQVHQRCAKEKALQDKFLIEIESLATLSTEDREALAQQRAACETLSEALHARLALLEEARNRAEQREKLHTEAATLEQNRADLARRELEFQPFAEQLRLAMAALELEGAYSLLTGQRQRLLEAQKNRTDLFGALPALQQAESTARTACTAASESLTRCTTEAEKAAPLLAQVTELDRNIHEKHTAVTELAATVTTQRTALETLKAQQNADSAAAQKLALELKTLEAQLEETGTHARLGETLSGLQADARHIQELSRSRDTTEHLLATAVAQRAKALAAQTQAVGAQETVRRGLQPRQDAIAATEQQRRARLHELNLLHGDLTADPQTTETEQADEQTLARWRDELSTLPVIGNTLKALHTNVSELGTLAGTQARLEPEIAALNSTLHPLMTGLSVDEALIPELEKQVTLLDRVRSLEMHREALQPGQPCPLCGSVEHGGALAHPSPDDTERSLCEARKTLADARQRLKEHQEHIKKTEVSKAAKDTELQQVRAQHATVLAHIHTQLAALRDTPWQPPVLLPYLREAVAFAPQLPAQFAEHINAGLLAARERYALIDKGVKDVEALDKQLAQLRAEVDAATKELHALALAQQAAAADLARATGEETRLCAELIELEQRLFESVDALRAAVEPLGATVAALLPAVPALLPVTVHETPPARPPYPREFDISPPLEALLQTLRALAETHARRVSEHTSANLRQATLTATMTQREAGIRSETERLNTATTLLNARQTELAALRATRRELFGDASPEEEGKRLHLARTAAAEANEAARSALELATRALGEHQTRLALAETGCQSAQAEADAGETAFSTRLLPTPFADEAAFCAARLPEARRLALQQQEAALRDEHSGLDTRALSLRQAREALEARPPLQDVPVPPSLSVAASQPSDEHTAPDDETNTPAPLPDPTPLESRSLAAINAEHSALETRRFDLQRESGALSQRLADDAAACTARTAKEAAMQGQAEQTEHWKVLDSLIGHSEGKTYSTFAQNITFGVLVSHANVHLGRMTDRYTLWPDPSKPMELCVADHYQASELRTTANLSGGETFIVSLALALGLSDMASRHTAVDSLFLDEGFGTLDAESLNMALEVLSSVQRSGKLIGIISHVPGLQERIPVRIEVLPRTGGRSELVGPGITSTPHKEPA